TTRHVIPAAEPPTSCLTSGNAAITCGKTTASKVLAALASAPELAVMHVLPVLTALGLAAA
ncbi:hypothetical protein ACFYWP_41810, partial [Actinacidiphila glaucinigra]|uniref:hypothetical protein n=1 Tax=Actinacidiphila glaucinigra TaxID=235986 RepID=UPI0036CB8FC6